MDGEQNSSFADALPASLVTRRLVLRQPKERDIPAIVREIGNFNVSKWLGRVPYPYVPRHARLWFAQMRRRQEEKKDLAFLIALRSKPDRVIGGIGCHDIRSLHPTVGYWLAERYWGKGYGREALDALLRTLFELAPAAVPVATALPDNSGSIALLRGAGFRREPGRVFLPIRSRRIKLPVLRFTYVPRPEPRDAANQAPTP